MSDSTIQRVSPSLVADPTGATQANAYFGVRVDAAVDLLEAREYDGLERTERLRKALGEQHNFLNSLLATSLDAAFDLRLLVNPARGVPLEVAILGRAWGADDAAATASGAALARQILALLPRHVAGSILEETEVDGLLDPFGDQAVDSCFVTKCEVTGTPSRPDAKVDYYFSIVPFNWVESDWTSVYSALAASPVPVVMSVGLLPLVPPPEFTQQLLALTTFYGRLAREDQRKGGLYYGEQHIPPDAFAVEAEQVFQDLARRCGQRAFGLRIQLAAPGAIPAGLAEAVAAAISPLEIGATSHTDGGRVAASYELRRPKSDYEADVARWNLDAIDFRPIEGRPEIWQRPDPPHDGLRSLAVLGDARDASCAFRLPIAVDGVVPGFRVGRGQFGHAEAFTATGAAVTLGSLSGTTQPVTLPLTSLTKHALIAGSTGSGKTTTVLELLRQLWVDHGVPFLVIEPVNSDADDYRKLLGEPGFEALEIVTIGDDSVAPLRFNPFEVPLNTMVGEHMANLLAAFKAAFGLWEPLPSIYQDALDLTYLRAGILSSERADGVGRKWPTAVEFMRAMGEATEDLGYAGEVKANIEAASIRRAQQMASGATASTFLTDQPNDIGRLLDHPVVVELKSLGTGDEQALMIALLLNGMTEHYQAVRGASPRLEHVTVIEEAHRLLARPSGGKGAEEAQAKEKAAESFANTLAENRKYGEGIVIAEQIPVKLVEDAVKNTALKVMHRLTAEEDRRYLGESMGLDDPQMRFTTRLRTGEALVYSDEFTEATHLEISRTIQVGAPLPAPVRPAPPFASCDVCRAKCDYRGAALAMVRDPAVVRQLEGLVAALEDATRPAEEIAASWGELIDELRGRVTSFAALPSDGDGVDDAAYCLFLHGLAIRTMNFSPAWPEAVAQRLGIPTEPTNEASHV